MSDERESALSGARVSTGHKARMCCCRLCEEIEWYPSPAERGKSKFCSTNVRRENAGVPRAESHRATTAAGATPGRASTNSFESGKIPESLTSADREPRSCAGASQDARAAGRPDRREANPALTATD